MDLSNTASWIHRAALSALCVLGVGSSTSFAQSDFDKDKVVAGDGETFQIGSSCAAMAYLEQSQIQYMISPAFKEEFQSFCYPEEPFDCSDYVSLLRGLAMLESGLDGYYCKLVLK